METQFKALTADVSLADGERGFVATITTDSVDRDSDVLLPDGLNAREFERSGTIFFDHGQDPNIGHVPVAKPVGLKRNGNSWVAKGIFVPRPETHPESAEWFPDTLHHLVKYGVIRGTSVGFIPIESRKPTVKDREMFGDKVERVFSKWEMTEFSITAQPANQDALISAVSKGAVSAKRAKSMFGVDVQAMQPVKQKKVTIVYMDQYDRAKPNTRSVDSMVDAAVKRAVARTTGRIHLTDL